MTITIERLREVFHYDGESGTLTWRINVGARARKGSEAGTIRKKRPYRVVRLDGQRLYVHRIIWAMTGGAWPNAVVDHINGDPSDNRLANLRECTQAQNVANSRRPKNNTSGVKGVQWIARDRIWQVVIRANGTRHYLGRYTSKETAAEAYRQAAARLVGEFARTDQ